MLLTSSVAVLALFGLTVSAPASEAATVVNEAVRTLANCGDACKAEKGLSADVWNLRKRVATRDELAAMAVLVEQGEESCLCGKTAPTATEIEKQGMLLAEAVVLYHLAGDPDGVRYNTQRLRNVVAKVAGKPDERPLTELLVRVLALAGGELRTTPVAAANGYAAAAIRELAGIKPDSFRIAVLLGAASSSALPRAAREQLLAEARSSLRVVPATDAKPLAERLSVELARLADPGSESRPPPVADAPPDSPLGQALALARELPQSPPSRLAAALSAMPPELRVWSAGQVGELASLTARQAIEQGSTLPPGAIRVAFLTGVAKTMTRGSDRARYEDILILRSLPTPLPTP